jgi:hypothetical protein
MSTSGRSVGLPPLRERAREQAPLWFSFFGGAAFWGIRIGVSYMLVPVACDTAQLFWLHFVAVVTIAASLLAAFVGYRAWHHARDRRLAEGRLDTWERTEFLGLSGLLLSAFFAGVIILESTANLIVDPCLGAGVTAP